MKTTRTTFVALMAATLLAGCGQHALGPAAPKAGRGLTAQARPGEVVVKFKGAQARQAVLQRLGLKAVARVNRLEAVVVKAPNAAEAIAALKQDPNVLYAEPNYVMKAIAAPATPGLAFVVRGGDDLLPKLWGMAMIGAEAAWARSTGKGAKIAIVDTGIDYKHPDLKDRVVDKGKDFSGDNPDAFDDHYHGSHCAGSAAASRGNGGVVGVAPEASLIAVKVLSAEGSGSYAGVASGIVYAADAGAHVISMSLGGPSTSAVIDEAVKYAQDKGALMVAAMGNDGSMQPSYPAACKGVLAVGATSPEDTLPNFTNCGDHISVTAPGVEILSTVPGGGHDTLDGTSMATPHVAGLAALLKAAHPSWGAKQIRDRIEKSATDKGIAGFDPYFGHGRIHAGNALAR